MALVKSHTKVGTKRRKSKLRVKDEKSFLMWSSSISRSHLLWPFPGCEDQNLLRDVVFRHSSMGAREAKSSSSWEKKRIHVFFRAILERKTMKKLALKMWFYSFCCFRLFRCCVFAGVSHGWRFCLDHFNLMLTAPDSFQFLQFARKMVSVLEPGLATNTTGKRGKRRPRW